MQLEIIIAALRARCPTFAGRVAGAAQLKLLPETAGMSVPCAFVVPLDDNPGERRSQNAVRQSLNESFAVIVAISNVDDERGQSSAHTVSGIRAELWAALLGWSPDEAVYDGMAYEGGSVIAMDRARLWFQFEFSTNMEIGPSDGYQAAAHAALPHFDGMNIQLDAIDPADPNVANPGPDERIEVTFTAPPSGNLP